MPTHKCEHEADIAVMAQAIKNTEETTQKIYQILTGNGDQGLVTQTALTKKSLERIWWFVGVMCVAVVGLCGKIIYSAII